jgi:hypothetical protein
MGTIRSGREVGEEMRMKSRFLKDIVDFTPEISIIQKKKIKT